MADKFHDRTDERISKEAQPPEKQNEGDGRAFDSERDRSTPQANTREEIDRMPGASAPSDDEAEGEGEEPADQR